MCTALQAAHGAIGAFDDCMDAGGRATPGAVAGGHLTCEVGAGSVAVVAAPVHGDDLTVFDLIHETYAQRFAGAPGQSSWMVMALLSGRSLNPGV
jgi:hypothetical protein